MLEPATRLSIFDECGKVVSAELKNLAAGAQS
jgi:hypothetical protein